MARLGGGFTPGAAVRPATKIELTVSCKNLADKDILSKSDPFVVVCQVIPGTQRTMQIARTETVKDDLNPIFQTKISLDYFFEERQMLEFGVYDCDDPTKRDLSYHESLGTAQMAVGEIVSAPQRKLTRPLRSSRGNTKSTITVQSQEVLDGPGMGDIVKFQIKGVKLDQKDFLGKSDPYLHILRIESNGSESIIHKTEIVKNTLDPSWRPFDVTVGRLCNGDYTAKLKFDCYDWDAIGEPDFIGSCTTSLQELVDQGPHNFHALINPKKQSKKGYKDSGSLQFYNFTIEKRYSFLDYVQGGTDINFTVAIDFTASNGAPSDHRSLHYMGAQAPNEYEQAIHAVGEIVQDYDSDKLFPALGFGAKIPPHGVLSHEFFLNNHPTNPYCQGVQGIIQAYKAIIPRVQLFGPTNFTPVIKHVARFAAENSNAPQNYFVLLIITDGVITDFADTVSAIVQASHLPMSIIIVGVGQADFSAMDALDADDNLLTDGRNKAVRDIVQFVSFRDFNSGSDPLGNQARLAKAVLAEVPRQLTSFMALRGFQPGPGRPERSKPPPPLNQDFPPSMPPPPIEGQAVPYPSAGGDGAAPYAPSSLPYPSDGSAAPGPTAPGAPPGPGSHFAGAPPYSGSNTAEAPLFPGSNSAGALPYPPPGGAGAAPYP